MMVDLTLLTVAVIWIYRSLRHDPKVMGNEKFMALHLVMTTLSFFAFLFFDIENQNKDSPKKYLTSV